MKFTISALTLLLSVSTPFSSAFTTTTTTTRRTFYIVPRVAQQHQERILQQKGKFELWSILDSIESDAYDLTSTDTDSGTEINMNDAYDVFLAELVFSTNNPKVDIFNNLEKATDPEFMDWLNQKVENSKDPEERIALRDLHEMIVDVKTQVEVNQLAAQRKQQQQQVDESPEAIVDDDDDNDESAVSRPAPLTPEEVLKKASEIDSATTMDQETIQEQQRQRKKSFYDTELTPEIRLSYQKLLKRVMPPYKPGVTPDIIVQNYYPQFDAQFVKVLNEQAMLPSNNDETKQGAQALLQALAVEQQVRLAAATEKLKKVLASGSVAQMEGTIVKMAREGEIDEAFLLLLEANETQARDAGAVGPAQVMEQLRKRAADEKDKQASSKEIRLIRQLLRTDNSEERVKLLEDAFTPRENLLVPGTAENAQKALEGEAPEQAKPMPEVPPPDFINACKAVLINFGNLSTSGDDPDGETNSDDLASRIKTIANEAEVVATKIYGKGMTPREQQDRAWKEQTTSIFDLERMELEAESMGESAPWTNPDAPDELIPGFDAQGRMQIGGN